MIGSTIPTGRLRARLRGCPLAIFGFVLGLIFARPGYAQISPGPLARAHESLSGSLNCTKCHELGAGRNQLKCLTCHTEIAQRLTERRGMHAVWAASDQSGKACASCHSDHNGADFPLVHWQTNREALNHSQTGFVLTGKHVGLPCSSCHWAEKVPTAGRTGIRLTDLNRTYLGLSRNCSSCHVDEHRGQLGPTCTRCHTADGWRPVTGFDHSATRFVLTGAHAAVACVKCHAPDGVNKAAAVYKGLKFSACTDCHTDPHKGSFEKSCQSCHDTRSWTRGVRLTEFDHSKTTFALKGKHAGVACMSCHRSGNFNTRLAHGRCADCHEDAHRRQFAARVDGGDCASCHSVAGFKPSSFDVKAHAATRYPLDGRHGSVACQACHQPKGKDTVFRIANTQCAACHLDIHAGQFASALHNNRCEDCHRVTGFSPALFTVVSHRETRFSLTGAHSAIPCADCHSPPTTKTVTAKYRFEDRSCTACHKDPHRGEFQDRLASRRTGNTPPGCETCHGTARWSQVTRFDHSTTRFPLLGAHRGAVCADCHRPPNLEASKRNVDYREAPKECAGCHEDPHSGQFSARKDANGCASCHNVASWRPAEFDHDVRTRFALTGAHQKVACSGCHKPTRPDGGRIVLTYASTPSDCKACHG